MTTLNRWDPFQEAMTLREAMSRLFDESVVAGGTRAGQGFTPALDLSETADAYHVDAAVPGLRPEDLSITFENGVLTISGEVHQGEEQKERSFHRVERRYGRFSRAVSLPSQVRGDAISARLEHGVLHLEIPKAEEIKPRKITVQVS